KLLQNILVVLDDENYAQASNLINRYIHGSYDNDISEEKLALLEEQSLDLDKKIKDMRDELLKQDKEKKIVLSKKYKDIEEEELINKFGLFREKGREAIYNPVAKDEMIAMEKEINKIDKVIEHKNIIPSTADIMASFNSIKDDIPIKASIMDPSIIYPTTLSKEEELIEVDNTSEQFYKPSEDDLVLPSNISNSEELEEKQKINKDDEVEVIFTPSSDKIEEEDLIDLVEEDKILKESIEEAIKEDVLLNQIIDKKKKKILEPAIEDEHLKQLFSQDKIEEENRRLEDERVAHEIEEKERLEKGTKYEPISYIDQKLRNMLNQYPQIEETPECFESEERLLYKISLEGYSEKDIEDVVKDIKILKGEGNIAEASHLLLTIATTESLYAQFTLARELYQGNILVRDLPEAFTQINYLAMEEYPEAVCDLAQFYEHGIGIKRDRKRALGLYADAEDLGVTRAREHYDRLDEELKGFLGKLFN
nr:sel1 repeat family protein [Sulfurovaceae bacterium]